MEDNGAGSDFWSGSWAAVTAGAKSYIGKVVGGQSLELDRFLLDPAYELIVLNIPIQTPQGVALQKLVNCVPIGATSNDVKIYVQPTDVMYLDDLKESDRVEYKKLVEGARQVAIASRAGKAGIQLASAIPKSPGRA